MAKGAAASTVELSRAASTMSTEKSKTLVLRKRVNRLQHDTKSHLTHKLEEFKTNVNDKSMEDIDDFIDEVFDESREKVDECFKDMKKEVKSHAPKRPTRQEGESEAKFKEREKKYEEDFRDYLDYVAATATVMSGIMELFTDVLTRIKRFFNDLWNWIKICLKDVGRKISDFLKMVSDAISDGLKKIFN